MIPSPVRWVAEEYILDTLATFEGSRVECVKRLVGRLPLEDGWQHQALLAEVCPGLGKGACVVNPYDV